MPGTYVTINSRMFSDPIKFYLVRDSKIGSLKDDFRKIINDLATYGDIGFNQASEGDVTLSFTETPIKANLKTSINVKNQDYVSSQQIILTCERKDNVSVNILKNITSRIGYRIFNPQNNYFLVNNPGIIDLTTFDVEEKVLKIFKNYELTPLFQFQNSLVYFAQDNKGNIRFINRNLLEHLLEQPADLPKQKDFSVIVAKDVGHFVALFDRGVIPTTFYEYFFNQVILLNLSGVNIHKTEKEIYVAPLFFQYSSSKQNFTSLKSEKDFSRQDKLHKGRSVRVYLQKLLKDFKIKNTILAVKIARNISYVFNQKGVLTPRLNVNVFLDE